MHDAIGLRGVAPEFVRKIEYIGEEIRHVNERLASSEQSVGQVLALRDGVVPMFHPPPFVAEKRIWIVSYIPRGVPVRIAGFEILVDENTVVHRQAGFLSQTCHRSRANTGNEELKIDRLPVSHPRFRAVLDSPDFGLLENPDDPLDVIRFEKC